MSAKFPKCVCVWGGGGGATHFQPSVYTVVTEVISLRLSQNRSL